jgi:putative ABC transport system permease protein
MIFNFFKIAIRSLFRQKAYGLINLTGLSIGLASFILIVIYVQHELSYDKFFKNTDRLYRVGLNYNIDGVQYYSCLNPVPLAEGLKHEFSEIESVTRLYNKFFSGGYTFVKYEEKQFKEEKLFWADSTVFNVLGINLIIGNSNKALRNTNSVVLTPKTAKKYFGDEDPIGKMLKFDDGFIYQVTGIAEPFPVNSHLHFDLIASIHTNQRLMRHPDWIDVKNYVYILLKEGATINQIENQIDQFQEKHLESEIKYITKLSYKEFKEKGNGFDFMFEPVTDIHLKTIFEGNAENQSSIKQVVIFAIIGIIILIVACINFINLTTAVASKRAKEVGVRKVVGSTKKLMILQFLIETSVITSISVLISILLVELSIPAFNNILNLRLHFSILDNWFYIPFGVVLIVFVSFLSGFYPSIILSSYKAVDIMKGKLSKGENGKSTRFVLVVVQNVISILLIISTVVIYLQIDYMHHKELGFNTENLLIIQRPYRLKQQTQAFKEIIDKSPHVISSTYSYGAPQMVVEAMVYFIKEKEVEESYTVDRFPTDFDFMDTYGIQLLNGRKLDKTYTTDSTAVILNETAVRIMGLNNPLEKEIYYSYEKDVPLKVIGIAKDFHTGPLQIPIRPTIIIINRDRPPMYYIVKYKDSKAKEAVQFLKDKWNEFLPGEVLDYKFLDQHIKTQYNTENQAGIVIFIFSILAIFIAGLGLFGMASYMINTRIKEIGIRKVMGATFYNINKIMFIDILKWVVIANIIAWPFGYFIMNKWLNNFAFRIDLNFGLFIFSGLISLAIAVLTIGYKTLKASSINPTECLRYE